MRRYILTVFNLLIFQVIFSQQLPHYTQYVLNNFILNPAIAGIENYWDVKASHRHQWVGLDGSPVTTYLTIQGPLKKNDYSRQTATSFTPEGENPRGTAYWENYQATDPHHGIGFTLLNDRTGPLNRFSASISYAYHLPIGARTSLSGGVSAGMQDIRLNTSKLDFGVDNPVDPAIAGSGDLNKWRPDISVGVWLYSADYFIGAAAQNVIPQKLVYAEEKDEVTKGRLIPHLFVTAGYRFFLNDDIGMLPSVMIKYLSGLPVSFDINAKAQYHDFLWAGASYRYKDGYAAMVGMNISSLFNLGYSYDVTTSGLNTVSRGSHEIIVGFMLGNHYGDLCPRNVW